MKEKTDLDTNLMFDQACAFVDCAEYLEREPSGITHRTKSHNYIDLSISALACEIFIKCLIIHNGESYNNGHMLDKLWIKYKECDQAKSQEVEDWINNYWFKSENPDLFSEMITDASKAFEQWRYIFDYDSSDGVKVNPQFLRGFRSILKNLCISEGLGGFGE